MFFPELFLFIDYSFVKNDNEYIENIPRLLEYGLQ